MDIVLTVDVEDWYQTNGFNFHPDTWHTYEDHVVKNTVTLLNLLDQYNVKGTFFVLGYVAEKHPELVMDIFNRGHEIGCHSHFHKMINQMEKVEVLEDIRHAKELLESIVKEPVKYFRAPSWSLGVGEVWILEELVKMGFKCDSSIQPFKTPLSGFDNGPTSPIKPIVDSKVLEIIEFPVSIWQLGPLKIPYSGGFYMRVMPYFVIKGILKLQKDKEATMIYLHPWEYDQELPKMDACLLKKLIHSFNVKLNPAKLKKLLRDFKFISLGKALQAGNFKAKRLN